MPVLPTCGSALGTDRSPTNVRVVPDLRDELLVVVDRLKALLGSVAVWEMEDDVGLRVAGPVCRRKAVGALSPTRPSCSRLAPIERAHDCLPSRAV
jgi:hypothetical protein